jgi:hypothetical protein
MDGHDEEPTKGLDAKRKSGKAEKIRAQVRERKRRQRERSRSESQRDSVTADGHADEPDVKWSRATTFESGEPAAVPAYEAPDAASDEPLWAVMRRVFRQDERDDKGHSERRLREMLKRDPKAYLQQMIAFEKEDAQQRAADERAKAAVGKREDEPNAERLRQLCRTLIADLTKPKE